MARCELCVQQELRPLLHCPHSSSQRASIAACPLHTVRMRPTADEMWDTHESQSTRCAHSFLQKTEEEQRTTVRQVVTACCTILYPLTRLTGNLHDVEPPTLTQGDFGCSATLGKGTHAVG